MTRPPPSAGCAGAVARAGLLAVAGQLDVAVPRDRPSGGGAGDRDRPLPVAERGVELLVGEVGADVQVEPLGGDREPPAVGVAGAAPRARPAAGGGEADGAPGERPAGAVAEDERPLARRVGAAAAPAQAIEHQLAAVVELEGEPVPAHLVGAERARAPLAVHPGQAGDGGGPAPG